MVRKLEAKRSEHSLKLLCSYGGKILLRFTDGKLRYVGGHNRVLSVDRSISFTELMVKLGEFCGYSVTLRCQLPNGDLETLISIKSDEELANLIELYDDVSPGSQIRAVLSPPTLLKQISPPPSTNQSLNFSPTKHSFTDYPTAYRFLYRSSSPPIRDQRKLGRACCPHHHYQGNPRISYCDHPHCSYWN
ncbi:PB1 domain-containing protein [Cephalotus follicularis]|uniref:PB1 domain-containing protein n=1 Tax=Cephalotus follicularis TaxID=3775 RepID=A0A1Q3B9G2_CEPFO|nr:PB1 domain-containing protein [Cephalotus follicularis]